jgi:phosphoglycerate dehydrogenase-like enzyme
MRRPKLIVWAGPQLFQSFFPQAQRKQLTLLFDWKRNGARKVGTSQVKELQDAEAFITTWDSPCFSNDLPRIAPRLRVIAHCGGEVKSRFARSLFNELKITNTPEPMARATAEMGATFLLYCARNVDYYREKLRSRSNRIYEDLHLHGSPEALIGREVCMIGFGRIGRALVDLLRGFDLRWLVYDPYVEPAAAKDYPVQFASLPRLLRRAELLVLTAALTEETRGLLNSRRLSELPEGASVINIARGGLIDLAALTAEVRKGRLRCALDVTDPHEPLAIGHPLRRLPGAIVTPHIAGSHRSVRPQMADVAIDDLERFFSKKPVRNRVTTAMLDRMS